MKVLSSEDNIKVGKKTVNRLVNNYKKTGVLENRNSATRRRPKLNKDHLDYIDSLIQDNGEITAVEIVKKLKSAYDINISKFTVLRARRKLGWCSKKTEYA